MQPDPVLAEVWRVRDELAEKHGFDVEALGEALIRRQEELKRAGATYVPAAPRRAIATGRGNAAEDQVPSKRAG
jgi:hypothetical protein